MRRTSAKAALVGTALLVLSFIPATRAVAAPSLDVRVDLSFHAGNADVDFFHDSLAPYGDWMQMSPYGWVWAPRAVRTDWRPYLDGHWVYTDYEWTWVSDEDWGWAPYHYGRWALDHRHGWVWVPGTVWAPAWVSWRWGDGYAGWAPLPPEVDITVGPANYGIDPLAYTFVEARYITEPVLVRRCLPPARNVTLVRVTENVTRYEVVDNRVVNRGFRIEEVERVTGHAVPRARIADIAAPGRTHVRGDEVAIYKPPVPRATAQPTRVSVAEGRHPAPHAPAPAMAEMQQRHEEQRRDLEQQHVAERSDLHNFHAQEKATPPPTVNRQELDARHKAELQAQAQHEDREKRLLADRQARERQPAEGQRVQHQEERHASPPPEKKSGKDEKHK